MWLVDRLVNFVSGVGTLKDKASANAFGLHLLSPVELNAMHRSDWLARKIVDIIPHDMTREWRDWQADDEQIEAIEESERALDVQRKVNEALQRARLLGGAALFIGTGDPDPAEELRVDRLGKGAIRYLHVVSKEEVIPGEMIRDVLSPYFGQPAYYEITSPQTGSVRIHPSRVIPFVGAPILDRVTAGNDPWGDSILQVVYDAVQNAASAAQHVAGLIPEAKVDVIKVPGLSEHLSTADGTSRLTTRFTLMNQLKSTINAVLLEGDGQSGETWEQKRIDFTQFPELIRLYLQIAAGAADIPVTRLLGQSPSGLNATGDADIRNYYDNLASRQEVELRPTMAPLDEILIRHALGSRPKDIHYAWAPLWQLDEVQKAEVAKKKAETTQIYVNAAILPQETIAKAATNQLIEDGIYPGLEAAIEEFGSEIDPDVGVVEPGEDQEEGDGTPVKRQPAAEV